MGRNKGKELNYHGTVFQAKLWDAFVEFQMMHGNECSELWGNLQAQCTKSVGNYCEGDNFN